MQCKLQWHKGTASHRLKGLTVQELCGALCYVSVQRGLCYVSVASHVVLWYFNETCWGRTLSQIFQNGRRDSPHPLAHIFLVITGKLIKNYIIKISEGKCNSNEKNNYANNFDERHGALYVKSLEERKLIFIESSSFYFLNFYLSTKKRFL